MDPPPRALHHPPYTSGGGGGSSGGREDCWSEDATEALVEAWGDRYLQLSRGNLRQKDWKDVADAVNEHQHALGRPRKTDIQCKNRIDTLKKKYKLEKSKLGPSQWTFYSRINDLIGTSSSSNPLTPAPANKKPLLLQAPPPPPVLKPHTRPSITFTVKQRPRTNLNPAVYSGGSSSRSRMNSSPVSTDSSHGESGAGRDDEDDDDMGENDDEDDDGEDEGVGLFRGTRVGAAKRRRLDDLVDAGGGDGGVEGAFVELARAIVKFGEIYEKVESSKQQQMMELERQRMEFAKELEFQRMQMFMEAQLDLEKMKRPKYASAAGSADGHSMTWKTKNGG